jgi:hypothetical protein
MNVGNYACSVIVGVGFPRLVNVGFFWFGFFGVSVFWNARASRMACELE